MTPERWKRITEVYSEICDLAPDQQAERLQELCADDQELRQQIEHLLQADPSEGKGFVDKPPFGNVFEQFPATGRRLERGEILAERFEVIAPLGAGGMGEVYEAQDRHLNNRVAIKLVRHDIPHQADALARFRREIALARQVTHRSVCRVFDFFPGSPTSRGDHVDFLTMELLQGETLADMIKRDAPLTLSKARPILAQLTAALDAAHAARVLHRDLKGSNVFLTSDADGLRVVITDFGLARSAMGGDTVATGSAWGVGTPLFMSPEQLEGGEIGPASDIYSLGVLMFQMATGSAPLEGNSPLQIAVKRVKEQPKSPKEWNPRIEPSWEAAIMRCLAIQPKARFQTGAELLAALGRPHAPLRLPKKTLPAAAVMFAVAAAGWWASDRFSTPSVRPEVARWYREGEIALADSAISKASTLFGRALQADPAYLSARCRLAETYIELDMRDRAQEEILQAVSARPRSGAERLLCAGVQATLTGQWDQALATANDRSGAELDAARWNERAGRVAAAAAIYEALIHTDGSQPGPLLRLANIRIIQGKNAEAATLLDRADANFMALSNAEGQGEVALARSRIASPVAESIRLAEEAERRAKETGSEWLLVRAMIWRSGRIVSQGDTVAARKVSLEAIATAEKAGFAAQAVNGFVDLGFLAVAQRRYEEAIPDYQRALELAVRYRARRAEARTRLSLGQLYMILNQLPKAGPFIDDALAFFRSTGETAQTARALRFRGDLYEQSGKFDEARKVFLETLSISPAPNDQLMSRQRLAYLARQQRRYEEAVERFGEVVDSFEKQGNRVSAQAFRLEMAESLTALGRFRDASANLDQVRNAPPANDKVLWQLDSAQADLDFQQLKFDSSLARLEAMRARARKNGQDAEERSLRHELCVKYAEAGQPAKAAPLCAEAIEELAGRPANLSGIHYALAEIALLRKQPEVAVADARRAVRYSEESKDLRNSWYSLLVLTQALHAAANPEWKQTLGRARSVFTEIEKQGGSEAAKTYLSRPLIARRLRAAEALQ